MEKNKNDLDQDAQSLFNDSRLITNEKMNGKILEAIATFCKENPFSLIEGFPKNIGQAIAFQNKSLIPDKIIFVNVNRQKLLELSRSKIIASYPSASE